MMKSLLEIQLSVYQAEAPSLVMLGTMTILTEQINGEHRTVNLNQAIETLGFYWPRLFPYGILRPMEINMVEQLIADKTVRQLPFSDDTISKCITVIEQSVAYQATLMPGAARYDSTRNRKVW